MSITWRVEFDKSAEKELKKLERQTIERILLFLRDKLEKVADPRILGEPLRGSKLGDFWKYRVGDYRIICKIDDILVVVYVVKIGHRRNIYK